jgi:hypothetical protein
MRTVAMLILAFFVAATTARAQTADERRDDHRVIKALIGAGALVAGTAVAAKSSKTTTTDGALGRVETSEFSTSQLVTGLVIAGTGGFLLWDGLRSHEPDRPSTRVGVGVGRRSTGVFLQRRW